jgi:hypothetical protein
LKHEKVTIYRQELNNLVFIGNLRNLVFTAIVTSFCGGAWI